MTYNRFLYNSALYNAGRDEIGAIAKSVIQAHTGPHIQAVAGSTGGVSFISDFTITEGEVRKPPSRFHFPDLQARIRAVQTGRDDVSAWIRGWYAKDLPAAIYPVAWTPNLPASIFGLFEAGLLATIVGRLGQHDLSAVIQAAVADLSARMLGVAAPDLPAVINELLQPGQKMEPKLFACIHTPLDLPAILNPVQKIDLPGSIRGFQYADLPGRMLGIHAPSFIGFIKGFDTGTMDLPTNMRTSPVGAGVLPTTINPVFTGDTGYGVGLLGEIYPSGGFKGITSSIRSLSPAQGNLGAYITTAGDLDLPATLYGLGADNLSASVGAILLGEKDKQLPGYLQPLHLSHLSAYLNPDPNVAFLGATISALRGTTDLSAFIRVAETFVTAILTVSTLTGRDLRATIGKPGCLGGSGNKNLTATATAQHAWSLGASIVSFIKHDLAATINTANIFHAFDTIEVDFSPHKVRLNTQFLTCDSIPVSFSPFRGKNLGATISAVLRNADLAAAVTATFPLPRVVPTVSTLQAVNLQQGEPQNLQEIRVLLEGQIQEFLYIHGAQEVFTQDANEDWKINVSSFKPITEDLFGDFATARIRRLGSLTSFATMDEAVRFCIQAVIGFSDESNLSAYINATGGVTSLAATLGISSTFNDVSARILPGMNEPVLFASIASLAGPAPPLPTTSSTASLSASITRVPMDDGDLGGLVNYPGGASPPYWRDVDMLASVRGFQVSALTSYIQAGWSTKSLVFDGTPGEYVRGPVMGDLGTFDEKLTVAFWLQAQSTPEDDEGILGSYSDYAIRDAGFGFRWVDSDTLEFFVNGTSNYARADIDDDAPWYFVTGVYDATSGTDNIKLYLNAVEGATTGNYQQPVLGLANPLFLGKTSNVSSAEGGSITEPPLNAYVDSVGVWEDSLGASEVEVLYNAQARTWYPYYVTRSGYDSAEDLVLCWTFEDAAATLPQIESCDFTSTASGTMVDMTTDNVSSHVPSSNSVSTYNISSRYWSSIDSDNQPLSSTYQGSFSVCWVGTFEDPGAATLVGMWKSGDTSTMPSFRMLRRLAGGSDGKKIEVQIQDENGVEQSDISTVELEESTTEWHSIVFSYNADTLSWVAYVDGSLECSGTLSDPRETSTEFLLSASRYNGSITDYHRGKVDSVAVWDRALTDPEIHRLSSLTAELWLAEDSALSVNLRTWYRNGEVGDTSTRLYDWGGNNGPYLERVGTTADVKRESPN